MNKGLIFVMFTDTVLQPSLPRKKSVSKLEQKDTKKATKYLLTDQGIGSDGEFQTKYYKVGLAKACPGASLGLQKCRELANHKDRL